MNLEDILVKERTFCRIEARSKKRAIEAAAELIAGSSENLQPGNIYTRLMAREKLGPTGLGEGIALPHCRLPCDAITGALFTFQAPVEFESIDDMPVSIMFVLLVPETETEEHLKTMASLVANFEVAEYRESLLAASTSEELFKQALIGKEPTGIAADQHP